MTDTPDPQEEARDDFVGAKGDGIRLWRATEAMRLGEVRLKEQTGNLTAIESRASTLLGWIAPVLTALAVASVDQKWRFAALVTGTPLVAASFFCAAALRPKTWTFPGYTLAEIEAWNLSTELETRESLALAYQRSIVENTATLTLLSRWMSGTWAMVAAAPVLAALASLIISAS